MRTSGHVYKPVSVYPCINLRTGGKVVNEVVLVARASESPFGSPGSCKGSLVGRIAGTE